MLSGVMFLKIIGAGFVISGCTGAGYAGVLAMKLRMSQLNELKKMTILLKGEFRYGGLPLPEAFAHITGKLHAPVSDFLMVLCASLKEMSGQSFARQWHTSIDKTLKNTQLNKDDIEELNNFGSNLGFLDSEMQICAADMYVACLDAAMDQLRLYMQEKRRIYLCLGPMSGLLITLMLL